MVKENLSPLSDTPDSPPQADNNPSTQPPINTVVSLRRLVGLRSHESWNDRLALGRDLTDEEYFAIIELYTTRIPPIAENEQVATCPDSCDDDDNDDELAQVTTEQEGESSNQAETAGEEGEGEWADCEDDTEAEAVEEEKPKEEKLEFTKPTINQIKKEKPLSLSEKITNRDFESLNDGVTDLNSGVQMLKRLYGSIKSLVAMQNQRSKKKTAKEVQEKVAADGKPINCLTTLSTTDANELKTKSCLEAADQYDIERFLNPITRDETFKALFEEVDELNQQTEMLRTNFFDTRGHFLRDKYDSQSEVKLDRAQLNEYKLLTKKLATVVDNIVRNYNDDLLNMFRLA